MDKYNTEQEDFWANDFGHEYTERNSGETLIAAAHNLFSDVISRTENVSSFLELGANRGLNLEAIKTLKPNAKISAVEINSTAAQHLKDTGDYEVFEQSILDFSTEQTWDFTFTRGVLIHIAPEKLDVVYDHLYNCSKRYIMVCEYYSPSPVALPYRNNQDKLFKRDFAGDLLDRFNDLKLIDYGFKYHRDVNFPQDDLTWFLLEKK
ncbi:pseudaminic acid biosynthesis-associated methylase [Curvivirga sp.]|uniref:pseudaminic acid biosynthesis-associated methylase n=1 Tax=Curvivirga sp. TaxID=2856848 RepID=UPI003B5A1676